MALHTFYTLELETAVSRAVELSARLFARRCSTLVLENLISDAGERNELPADAVRMLELELESRVAVAS